MIDVESWTVNCARSESGGRWRALCVLVLEGLFAHSRASEARRVTSASQVEAGGGVALWLAAADARQKQAAKLLVSVSQQLHSYAANQT